MEALLQDSRIYGRTKQVARRRRNQKRQTKVCTAQPDRNDFLEHSFQPLTENRQLLKYQKEIEESYFNSLSNLTALYQFEALDVSDKVYPFNIYLSYEYAKKRLSIIHPDTKLIIINDESNSATLATVKVYDTGTCLYYIPVKPLFRLLKENRQQAELLLSIFAYLYQVEEIAYYGTDNSYLYYSYEAIEQWMEEAPEEWEEEEYKQVRSEIKMHKCTGSEIERKIRNSYQLHFFEKRINGFITETDFDKTLLEIASRCLALYKDYPNKKIKDSADSNLLAPDEEDSISVDQYVSFFWSSEGFLYEQVVDYVNTSIQELSAIDEPASIQLFNTPQTEISHQFNFEEKFFALLNELIELLTTIE